MNVIKRISGRTVHFDTGAGGIIGTREYQQDYGYLYADGEKTFGILCDGMGGLEGGERASKTAVERMAEDFQRKQPRRQILDFFVEEVHKTDKEVAGLRDRNGRNMRAGTTMLAALMSNGRLSFLSVGDSKIYLIRGMKIQAITPEHNYRLKLNEDLEMGRITSEKYRIEIDTPKAEALISFIGMNGVTRIYTNTIALEKGDIVLMCSDGLYKCMSDEQILAMVRDNDIDMEMAADRLLIMSEKCARRGQDNTTVILMRY